MKAKEKMSLVDLGKRLLEASRKGQAEEVSILMASGAPFTTDWLGTSPLHLAAQHGHTQTAEVLLRAGVSRDARTKVDRTPLHMAAQHGHTAIVDFLISSGASVNTKDMLNMTPLHWACEHNHLDIIRILLQSGAHTDIRSKFGKLPTDIAKQKGYSQALAMLLSEHQEDPGKKAPAIKREADKNSLTLSSLRLKRQRTKKFPMTAGSWTGADGPVEGGNKQRKKATTPGGQPKSAVSNGRRVSAPAQYPSAGSPSLRSPTENSIASLVSAAALVKAKAESEDSHGNKHSSSSTTAQDSSVLDTLATLATATLSHGTAATSTASAPQVATISSRPVSVTPLTLPPNTPSSVLSGLTTPLTPGGSLFPIPSPLVALSALSSLSSPIQTSPLPSFAMSPMGFSLPVTMTSAQVASLVQGNANLNVSTASTTSSTPAMDMSTTGATSTTWSAAQPHAQTFIPQQFAMAPFQIVGNPGGPQQLTLTPGGALLTQLAAGQPNLVVDLGGAAGKENAGKTDGDAAKTVPSVLVDLGGAASKENAGKADSDALKSQRSEVQNAEEQDSAPDSKPEELGPQNPQSATQDIIVTLQVPAGIQHLQQQLLGDQAFSLPQIQFLQQVAAGQDPGLTAQQIQTSTQISQAQVAQPQFTIVQAPQVQAPESSSQTPQDQTVANTNPVAQVLQLQLPQGAIPPGTAFQAPGSQDPVSGVAQLPQTVLTAQPQAAAGQTQQRSPQQQQTAQQQISQQLLTQSIPQGAGTTQALQGLLQQNYAAQLGQVQLQASMDLQQQQQTPQMLIQVQQDIRKMLERRQVEEDRSRKELEGKLMALQKDSDKYRNELQQAQKQAESYRGRLEEEMREKTRLHQLYEASKSQQSVTIEAEASLKTENVSEGAIQP